MGKNEAPIRIVGRLLGLAGVRLEYVRREGSRGERERVYRLVVPSDGREEIFRVWLERDLARREAEVAVSMNVIDQIYTQVVDSGGRENLQLEDNLVDKPELGKRSPQDFIES